MSKSEQFKILVLGQALPEKPVKVPFERTRLYKWLDSVNISKENFLKSSIFDAVLNFYPGKQGGKDRVPTDFEIIENIARIIEIIKSNKIKIIPLPHPSGLSTWIYQKNNQEMYQDFYSNY